jgi:hypothetical protein
MIEFSIVNGKYLNHGEAPDKRIDTKRSKTSAAIKGDDEKSRTLFNPASFHSLAPGSGMLCIRRDETPMRDSRDKKTAVRDCQIRPSGTAAYCPTVALKRLYYLLTVTGTVILPPPDETTVIVVLFPNGAPPRLSNFHLPRWSAAAVPITVPVSDEPTWMVTVVLAPEVPLIDQRTALVLKSAVITVT